MPSATQLIFDELLKLKGEDLIVEYYELSEYFDCFNNLMEREAEYYRTIEVTSAIQIQRVWRGFITRLYVSQLQQAALTIQKAFRGSLGRTYFIHSAIKRNEYRRMSFYHSKATLIQKIWRGYWCKRTILDYYARQAYLVGLQEKMVEVRERLQISHDKQAVGEKERFDASELVKAQERANREHHLIGTKSAPTLAAQSTFTSKSTFMLKPTPSKLASPPKLSSNKSKSSKNASPVVSPSKSTLFKISPSKSTPLPFPKVKTL